MTLQQIRDHETELRYQLLKLRFDLKNGKLVDSSLIKKNKRLIARLLTKKEKNEEI